MRFLCLEIRIKYTKMISPDSNSCTQRLELVKNKCDPFAAVSISEAITPSISRELPADKSRTPSSARVTKKHAEAHTKKAPLPTTSTSILMTRAKPRTTSAASTTIEIPATPKQDPTTEKTITTEIITDATSEKVNLADAPDREIIPLPDAATVDDFQEATAAAESAQGASDDANAKPKVEIQEIGQSLVSIQRQIRNLDKMESPEERENLAMEVREQLDTVSEDVEQLGQTRPEVLSISPRLLSIREELGTFARLNIASGLGSRLVLEVDAVRTDLLRVANNIQQGISDASNIIRHNVSNVAINVAEEAVGFGKVVGSGLQSAGSAIKDGVDSAQKGIAALSLEGVAQLAQMGSDVQAGVANVKSNFENLRQESFQRIKDSSDSVNMQLVSGLQRLHKLKEESTLGAQSLSVNIQKNLKERLDDMTKQFSSLRLTG